ncbi:MAG TPA: alpha-galactosidase [Terriglobales bacterium]|nr:alpha-galactosidase [Terriglobales bacterium]
MYRFATFAAVTLLGAAVLPAQSIQYSASTKVWLLNTGKSSYAMGVAADGALRNLYWGAPLWRMVDMPAPAPRQDLSSFDPRQMMENEEYPGWGGTRYYEPAVKISRADGDRDLVLHYVSHRIEGNQLDIEMKDIRDAVSVTLHYRVYPGQGILERSATIRNGTKQTLTLDSAQAATWYLPPGDGYQLTYLSGRWAAEGQINREPIHEGEKVIESRKGHTSHNFNPWFAIDHGDASEENGRVWFGALAWSGSWRIHVDQDAVGAVRVTAGYNPFDFGYRLKPGETLSSPVFHAGYADNGFGGASRLFHRYQRERILPGAPNTRLRPVLYNSWEATEFKVDEPGQLALAEKAASIGVERFVVDDGWFGARNGSKAGLGDWTVNSKKFPNGLGPLIKRVNELGMEFGLWVEPEMVNPDSDLYRAHPDWVINFQGRPRTEARSQLVLNLARREVYDHLLKVLDDLLRENNIAFLKWDHNRNWSEPGWPEAGADYEQKLYVEYVNNLYKLFAELRKRHPKLEIESCASGGGRVDLGILQYTEQVWTSDNTDPYDRLFMQNGFSHAYAPAVMMAWVTDSPNWVNKRSTSLEYRFLSSMQGGLGVGANLNHWSDADFATAKRLVGEYKSIRQTVQRGNLFRLIQPQENNPRCATLSVSDDGRQAVLFTFMHSSTLKTPQALIQLRGLHPDLTYKLRTIQGKAMTGTPEQASGAYWMGMGIKPDLVGDFQAAAFAFEAAP